MLGYRYPYANSFARFRSFSYRFLNQTVVMAQSSSKRKSTNEKITVAGYILNVSPMKRSRTSQKEYFNLDIETQTEVRNAVCFSPSKRNLFNEASVNHSGCEIENASNNTDNTIFVSDYSTVKTKELGFARTNQYNYKTITEVINEVKVDAKVNVRGVLILKDTRYVIVGTNHHVPIREGYIADETGSIKITLWREYTNLENNTTYNFLQLMKILYGSDLVLQSIHSTSYNISDDPVEDFEDVPLAEPTVLSATTFIGLESDDNWYCPLCKAQVNAETDMQIVRCEKCQNQILMQHLTRKLSRKVTVHTAPPIKHLSQSVIEEVFSHRDIHNMDETQLTLLLLSSTFTVAYDESTSNIVSLQLDQ